MSDADNDFKLVSPRRWRGKCSKGKPVQHTHALPVCLISCDESGLTDAEAKRGVISAKNELAASHFYSSLEAVLTEAESLLPWPVREILCYGVGHFSECKAARYQFSLLLLLGERLKAKISVHDPLFHRLECRLVEDLGCTLVCENEEAKHPIEPNHTTLVFLPHCPRQLTNNFLWANWGPQLQNCVVFANSFSKIETSQARRLVVGSASFILDILPYTTELAVAPCPEFFNAFNDLAIHAFPSAKLSTVAKLFWQQREEPVYGDEALEFITKAVVSKLSVDHVEPRGDEDAAPTVA